MGNALHRLEILLVGLVLLLAGAVVAVLIIVRSPSPSTYVPTTPQPIGTSGAVQPTGASATTAVGNAIPIPTGAPAPTSAPSTAAPTQSVGAVEGSARTWTWIIPPILLALWPYLLLTMGLGGIGLVVGRRLHKRRLPYTNQSVGMLLAAADPETRETNLRVMQNLAAQGLLTEDLAAAAAGIELPGWRRWLRIPRVRILRPTVSALRIPTISVPKPRLPRLRLSHRQQGTPTIDYAPTTPDQAVEMPRLDAPSAAPPARVRDAAALRDALAVQNVKVPVVELTATVKTRGDGHADTWSVEDRVMAVAGLLTEIWASRELTSPILALDTSDTPGNGEVVVTIEQHLDDDPLLVEIPDRITAERPGWRAFWRQDKLIVEITTSGALPRAGGPLIVPILAHGRGGKTLRFYPLASWRHLGLYGGQALHALHALLGSLLYNQPPSQVALAVIDKGEISPLYRSVTHLVPLPSSAHETMEILARAIRRGAREAVRPLVLVVVEPDNTQLNLLTGIAARIRVRPNTPVHLLIVQEYLSSAGRELYAMLPALVTGGGRGLAALLPGQGDWPRFGEARLVGQGMRVEGRPLTIDEVDAAAKMAQVRGNPGGLPVLWDLQAQSTIAEEGQIPRFSEPASVGSALMEGSDHAEPDTSTIETPAADMLDLKVSNRASDALTEDASEVSAAPMSEHEPVVVADITVPGTDNDVKPRSPLAARLRATLAAGRSDAAPLHAIQSQWSDPDTSSTVVASSAATSRTPADRLPELQPIAEPDNGWSLGPAPLGRVAMAELMARVASAPAIIAGQANELGVTKNRLVELLKGTHKSQARELAEILMAWFDLAGLLVEPTKSGRLRHPRALTTMNLTEIAQKLSTIACPDKDTVRRMWADSNEGRN